VFAVCNEMHNLTIQRVNVSLFGAVATGLVMYLVLASVGYATFGANVDADFLTNYPGEQLLLGCCGPHSVV
jgi:amino acid permease